MHLLLALQDLYQWSGAPSILPVLQLIETASQVHFPLTPDVNKDARRHPEYEVKAYAFEAASQCISVLPCIAGYLCRFKEKGV